MSVFSAARTNWRVPLDTRFYDLALFTRWTCNLSGDIPKDTSDQPITHYPTAKEDPKNEKKRQSRFDEIHEAKVKSRVSVLFGDDLPSSVVNDTLCDLLMIYSDAIEMGITLSLDSHQLMQSEKQRQV